MTPSSKCPVRNHQWYPRMNYKDGGAWHTSNHARELKLYTKDKHHISWSSMMSRMTPFSKYPVRNPQGPPSMTSSTGGLLKHIYSWYRAEIWHTSQELHPPRMTSRRGVIFTLIFMLESWNLAHESRMTSSQNYFKDGGYLHLYTHARELKFGTQVMTIRNVKKDPIHQVSSQEPATSSKYDFQDVGFLTRFLSC